MKINTDLQNFNAGSIKDVANRKEVRSAGTFSNLLDQASAVDMPGREGETSAISQASAVFQTPVLSCGQTDALAAGEQALELLGHCGCMLGDSDISAGALEPVARALGGEAQDLMQIRDNLDAQDPLRSAIDEIGIMSVVVSMKIDRGDFNG